MDPRSEHLRSMFGKSVAVTVDRPIGFVHHNIRYPINYGFIPGLTAGDGEEQDAYILGVDTPLSSFQGIVVGAVRRMNDLEDKLIVAPEGMRFHQAQLWEAVAFQEQFFQCKLLSLFQKACGVIPYRTGHNGTEFLVLLQNNNCWSFPKGHAEAGETEEQTALRELKEETGLSAVLTPEQRVVSEYTYLPLTIKQVVLFPGQVTGDITLQAAEIQTHQWVCASALEGLLHPDTYQSCKALLHSL